MKIQRILCVFLLIGLLAQSFIFPALGADNGDQEDIMKMSDIAWKGNHPNKKEVNNGVKCIFDESTNSWERVGTMGTFLTTGYGAVSKVVDITSAGDTDYSFVTMISNGEGGWYDTNGYMVIYGYSGNFTIIATYQNPSRSPVIVSEVREPLDGSVEVKVQLVGENYEMTVNGKTYTFAAKHAKYPLENVEEIFFSYGFFTDGAINDLSYDKSFDQGALSFVVNSVTHSGVSRRTFRPLLATMALMEGKDGKFRPDDAFTRGEAITALAKFFAVENDIKDTYTATFTDLEKSDPLYTAVALLEKIEYLPNFGKTLDASRGLTWGEFIQMYLEDAVNHTADGVALDNVPETDPLYSRFCYAVNQGFCEASVDPADTITRGEAARAICRLVGKEADGATLVSFSDVSADHPFAADIALVATALPVKEKTVTVAPGESIQDAINQAKTFAGDDYARVTIELKDGTHTLTETVVLTDDAYQVSKLEIIIKNAEGAKPVVSGNVDIPASSFTKVEGKPYYSYQLPDSAMDEDDIWPQFRNLYLNGQYLNIAATDMRVFEYSLRNTKNGGTSATWTYDNWFYLHEEDFEGITQLNISPMELCINVEWMTKIFRISRFYGYDEENGSAQIGVAGSDWETFMNNDGNKRDFKGWSYWLQNNIAFLDEPGEFYYDKRNGTIYFYPYADTNMKTATVSYSPMETLFKLEEVSNVTFEGITFTGTTSTFVSDRGYNGGLGGTYMGTNPVTGYRGHIPHGAIIGSYTMNVRVIGCTFDALGGHGIYLDYGNRNLTVKGNSFTDLAMSGVSIGRLDKMWNEYTGLINVVVDNNYINNIGIDYPLSSGILVSRVLNAAITHNTITHTPYCGIMANWLQSPTNAMNSRNVEIAYNYLEDNMFATNDGAPIYLPGANSNIDDDELFMYCHHNYLKATGYNKTYNGIYLDANASNWLVEYNVVDGFKTSMGPIFNQGTHIVDQKTYNNTVRNNYTTLERVTVKEYSTVYDTTVRYRNIVLENNKYYESSADLPPAARNIMNAAGQKAAYAGVIPVKDTVVDVKTSDAHVVLKKNSNPDKAYVTFTITNNSKRAANYRVVGGNDISEVAKIVVSTRCLTLQPGETGTIEVSFRGAMERGPEAMADFTVVKDNGWKREYHRVIYLSLDADEEQNPVLSEDEKLGEYEELLPPGGTFPPEDDVTPPETGDSTGTGDKSGMAPEIVVACVAIPVILIAVVVVILVTKKKK